MADDETSETLMKYKAAYAKYYPEERWSTFAAAGFQWIEILVEGLERAGRDLTRESFLEAVGSIKDFEGSAGIPISFSEDNHLGTRSLSIMRCKSATDYERISDVIESTTDVSDLIKMLEEE